jgi:uncharacterized membrane protein YciS (DUF1049 family)
MGDDNQSSGRPWHLRLLFNPKFIAICVIAAAIGIFAYQNQKTVDINILFAMIQMKLCYFAPMLLGAGFVIGLLAGYMLRKK